MRKLKKKGESKANIEIFSYIVPPILLPVYETRLNSGKLVRTLKKLSLSGDVEKVHYALAQMQSLEYALNIADHLVREGISISIGGKDVGTIQQEYNKRFLHLEKLVDA